MINAQHKRFAFIHENGRSLPLSDEHRAPVAQYRAVTREVVSSTPVGPTLRVFK